MFNVARQSTMGASSPAYTTVLSYLVINLFGAVRLAGERAARLTDIFVHIIVVIVHAAEHVHERPALLWILSS